MFIFLLLFRLSYYWLHQCSDGMLWNFQPLNENCMFSFCQDWWNFSSFEMLQPHLCFIKQDADPYFLAPQPFPDQCFQELWEAANNDFLRDKKISSGISSQILLKWTLLFSHSLDKDTKTRSSVIFHLHLFKNTEIAHTKCKKKNHEQRWMSFSSHHITLIRF